MGGDLKSRNAVINYIMEQKVNVTTEKDKNGFVSADVCYGMDSAIEAFMNFIEKVPVAFDVDKVIADLEKCKKIMESPVSKDC